MKCYIGCGIYAGAPSKLLNTAWHGVMSIFYLYELLLEGIHPICFQYYIIGIIKIRDFLLITNSSLIN